MWGQEIDRSVDALVRRVPGFPAPRTLPPSRQPSFDQVAKLPVLFPGDGQHRAASIREAIKQDRQLATVQIPVVFIPFKDKHQVRQVFADLNLNAKLATKTIGLAFDTRDPIATLSKRVADEVPLFKEGRVNMSTNSLAKTTPQVITLNTLYEANKCLLAGFQGGEDKVKDQVQDIAFLSPSDAPVGQKAKPLVKVWEVVINSLPGWQEVMGKLLSAGAVRDQYVSAHGLGWQAIAHAAAAIIRTEPDKWEQVLAGCLSSMDWKRSNRDWQGVAMVGSRVNNTGPGVRATAGYILKQGGVSGEYAQTYLDALERSRTHLPQEAKEEAHV
ncbi:MAG: DNA sulfur modification protein DndB [Nitrospinae bacterium]|nr:DNA sulfur modification protein DndB [Nitrospinota bacterium]